MNCIIFQGIAFEAYAPIGSPGRLAKRGLNKDIPVILDDPVVQEIATECNATPAQVIKHSFVIKLYCSR